MMWDESSAVGEIMVESSPTDIVHWCHGVGIHIDDINIAQYDYNLCEVQFRQQKDFLLATLRYK